MARCNPAWRLPLVLLVAGCASAFCEPHLRAARASTSAALLPFRKGPDRRSSRSAPLRRRRFAPPPLRISMPSDPLDDALAPARARAAAARREGRVAVADPEELAPWLFDANRALVDGVKGLVDLLYAEKPFVRFYVLEVATTHGLVVSRRARRSSSPSRLARATSAFSDEESPNRARAMPLSLRSTTRARSRRSRACRTLRTSPCCTCSRRSATARGSSASRRGGSAISEPAHARRRRGKEPASPPAAARAPRPPLTWRRRLAPARTRAYTGAPPRADGAHRRFSLGVVVAAAAGRCCSPRCRPSIASIRFPR